jgi:hypothetical protein
MAKRVIQFPVRNAFAVHHEPDEAEEDRDQQASRIAARMEGEVIRQAARKTTGTGTNFAQIRSGASASSQPQARPGTLRRALAWIAKDAVVAALCARTARLYRRVAGKPASRPPLEVCPSHSIREARPASRGRG